MTAYLRATFVGLFTCLPMASHAQNANCAAASEAWTIAESADDPTVTSDFVLEYSACSAFRDLGLAALRNQTIAMLNTLQSNRIERRVLDHDLLTLRTEVGVIRMQRDRAETKVHELLDQNDARLQAIVKAQSDIEARDATVIELNRANATLSRELGSATDLETALRADIAGLESRAESLEALEGQTRAELIETRRLKDALESVIITAREDLLLKDAIIEALKDNISDQDVGLERLEETIAEATAELAEAYRREALGQRSADDKAVRIADLEDVLRTTEAERDQGRIDLERAAARITDLTAEKEGLAATIDAQSRLIATLEGRIENLTKEKLDLTNELEEARLRIGRLNDRVAALLSDIERLTGERERLSATNARLVTENSAQAAQIESLQNCISSATVTPLDSLGGDKLGDLDTQTGSGCKDLFDWVDANVRDVEEKFGGFEVNLASLNTTNSSLAEEVSQLRLAINRLEGQVDTLSQYRSRFIALISQLSRNTPGIEIDGERARFTTQILFEPGSARLSRDGQARLQDVAIAMETMSASIPNDVGWIFAVEGHTDSDPITRHRRFQDNWDLAHGRAKAVVDYLVDSADIDPSWLAATAFGEFQPVTENNSEYGKSLNRRIEFGLVTYAASNR